MAGDNKFWVWFSENHEAIESYKSGDEKLLDEITEELHKYNENLYFEFSTHDEINEFIITAEGDSEHFDSVFTLIDSAPNIKGWKFIALKPAMGFEFITSYEGVDYNSDDLWFLPLSGKSNPKVLGLRVGIPNYDKKIHENSVSAIWILLDSGLGELKTTQEVHHVETTALPKNPEESGYIKVKEMEDYLEWRKKNT